MSQKSFVGARIVVGLTSFFVAACGSQSPHGPAAPPPVAATSLVGAPAPAAGTPSSLKVALYPWVPRPEQFKDVIASEWRMAQPTVSLEWVPLATETPEGWDGGYKRDPDPSYDVFVFDALNLGYFHSNKFLFPLQKGQVTNYADLVPFARTGVTMGDTVLAIPQLGCGDLLFYYSSDTALAAATTASAVASAIGSCSYFDEKPPTSSKGLMVELSGGTTVSSTYLAVAYEQTGQFPSPLPITVDPKLAATIQGIVGLSSFNNILYAGDNQYQRAAWFSEGFGRAYVGFTESMSQIDPQKLATVSFKPMPWSNNAKGIGAPLFYSDVVGVNATTSGRGTTALAVQLANLMTSPSVVVKTFGPYQSSGPQYLMPVSSSALAELSAQFPIYAQLSKVLGTVKPTLFNLGPNSKSWLAQVKGMMNSMVLANAKCYCDFPSPPIQDNDDAQTKCPGVCGARGWNGQWTNVSGPSVCGCNGACAAQLGAKARPNPKREPAGDAR